MAPQTPVASVDSFVATLAKSGLLSAESLATVKAAAVKAAEPKALARDLVKAGTLTKWQAGQLLHGFHLLTIGKFKLLDQIGSSEIGRVYLADHAQIGRKHTLNVLAKRHLSNPQVVEQFLADATRACGLDHRNICHTFDVSRDGDRCFVVMEHVEGQSLAQLVEQGGPRHVPGALELARQAAEGLAHAHANGVIHGSLAPPNVLLDETGTVKILDLGQSRLLAAPAGSVVDESQEAPSLASGIFHAPEQRAAQPQAAGVATDVYSLGSVLAFLLTGEPAADAAAAQRNLSRMGVPEEVSELCGKLMAANPAERPSSMAAVLGELASAARTKPAPPRADKSIEPVKAKKPPAAKPLGESAALPVARSLDDASAESPPGGFAIRTKGKPKKPPVKAAPVPDSSAAVAPNENAAPASANRTLLLVGAIGGGVLALAGIGVAIALFAFGGGGKQVAQAPKTAPAAAQQTAGESNPVEINPVELNPVPPAGEANPVASPPAEPPEPAPAVAAAKSEQPAAAIPAETAPPGSTPPPMPAVRAEPKTEPKPEPKAETTPPPKAKTPPPKTTPKTEPKAKPKAEPNPLEGFAKTIALPPLPEGMMPPAAEALAPLVLGPCKLDAEATVIAQLKGGASALRSGKLKFELHAKNGTGPRDWEFQLAGGEAPVTIATLAAKDDTLVFQWTDAAVKQAQQARLLCNCGLDLTAGSGKHFVALRQPASGPPLAVDFEKNASQRWTIDNLPDPKSIRVAVTRVEGLPKHKLNPAEETTLDEDVQLWIGPTEKSMPLGLLLNYSAQARAVQVAAVPQVRLEGMPKPVRYSKKEVAAFRQATDGTRTQLTGQLTILSKKKSKKGDPTDVAKTALNAQLEEANKNAAALDELLNFVGSLTGGKIQFRLYCLADDAQIDLLVTE